MQLAFSPSTLHKYSAWAFFEKAFSPEECKKILELFKNPESGKVGNNETVTDIRRSEICWLSANHDTKWIYDRISSFALGCNQERYKYDLTGFMEPLQLGLYREGSHYDWHQDFGNGKISVRKLSVVVQLSEPESYEGGELEFFNYPEKVSKGLGDLVVFPSFQFHRVTEVTKGQRYSLVAWISGPSFR